MLNKILLYKDILYKGELFKRLEYKIKDATGYFYVRNKHSIGDDTSIFEVPSIVCNPVKSPKDNYFSIFGDRISYNEIESRIETTDLFWRKYKLNRYNDIKKVWEINRLQFLLPLGLKNDTKLPEKLLDKWIECNKYEYSINWTNNLEVAIRSINIYLYLLLMNDNKLIDKYSKNLRLHGNYIYHEIDYSKYCIPNNHLIGEAVALLVLGKSFNNKKWVNKAIKIIDKFKNIIADDGASVENSFSYQFFVTKMFILALPFIDDKELYNSLYNKVCKSLYLLNMLTIDDTTYPNYGDNDGGYLFSFDNKYMLGKDIKRYYDMFFNNKYDYETLFVCSIYKYYNRTINPIKIDNKDYFYNDNIFVYRNKNNLLFFNAKDIKGHAHNDSLSINLFVDGREVIYDSGTFCYGHDKNKREYYVSRDAHSTILFDDINAVHVTTFRWNNKNKSYIEYVNVSDDTIEVSGIIEGICKRKLIINDDKIEVIDESLTDKKISSNWIVNDDIKINGTCIIYSNNVRIEFMNNKISSKARYVSKQFMLEDVFCSVITACNKMNAISIFLEK